MLYAGGFPNKQDPESVCRYVIGSEIEMLNDTLSLMDFSLMERVAELIDRARQVIFLGEGRRIWRQKAHAPASPVLACCAAAPPDFITRFPPCVWQNPVTW